MSSQIQSDQLVLDAVLAELGTASRDRLDSIFAKINTDAVVPGKLSTSGMVLTAGLTSVTGPDSRKKGFPPFQDQDIGGLTGTYNFSTAAVTGDIQASALPSMTASYYIKAGVEAREDKKLYVIWGQQGASASAATNPTFIGVPLGVITLHDNGTGGTGNFVTPVSGDITQFVGAGTGGGSGSGFKNYIKNTKLNSLSNITSANITVATTSTASEVIIGTTNIKLTSDGSTAGSIKIAAYAIDSFYNGTAIYYSLKTKALSGYTAGDMYVAVYNETDAAVVNGTQRDIPLGNKSLGGFFFVDNVAGTPKTYSLAVFEKSSPASSGSITIADPYIGPDNNLYFTELSTTWQSYVPTLGAGFGTTSNVSFLWRQEKDSIKVRGVFTTGTVTTGVATVSLPSGLIDPSKMPQIDSSNDHRYAGKGYLIDASGTAVDVNYPVHTMHVYVDAVDNTKIFLTFGTASGAIYQGGASDVGFNSSSKYYVEFEYSLANTSSNILAADRALADYAYNTDTTNADNTSSFSWGFGGVLVPVVATTTKKKRVRFQEAINADDTIMLIVKNGTTDYKHEYDQYFPNLLNGSNEYGMRWERVAGTITDIDVVFAKDGATPSLSWTAANSAGYLWFIVKYKGPGSLVGFPVSLKNAIFEENISVITTTSSLGAVQNNSQAILNGTSITVTLPLAASMGNGAVLKFLNINATQAILARAGSETISGATNKYLNQYDACELISYNNNWYLR